MLTRRRFMAASIAGGALLRARASFAMAAQPATPVSFEVPRGACDCHTHIHGDPGKFPFFPSGARTGRTRTRRRGATRPRSRPCSRSMTAAC